MPSDRSRSGTPQEIADRIEAVDEIRSGHELYQDDVSLTVEFEHLNEPQAIAIMAMVEKWERHGRFGSSRWVEFFADGDGSFHPSAEFETDAIDPSDDLFDELADVAEIDTNQFDFDAVVGWFIDQALEVDDDG